MNELDLSDYLFDYQKRIVEDKHKWVYVEKSRRIGGSYAVMLKAVLKALEGKNRHIVCISMDKDKSKELLRYAIHWLNICGQLAPIKFLPGKECIEILSNGSRIEALSSKPDASRSLTLHMVIWDEAAINPSQQETLAAIGPAIKWAGKEGQICVISTHKGTGTEFYRVVNEIREGKKKRGYSLHTVDIHKAIEQGIWKKLQFETPEAFLEDCRQECATDEIFAQEYECRALASEVMVKNYVTGNVGDTICECEYVGIDVGRTRNASVITGLDKEGRSVYTVKLQSMDFDQQDKLFDLAASQAKRIAIDGQGLGLPSAERLIKKHPQRVRKFDQTRRNEFIEFAAHDITTGKLVIPDRPGFIADVLSMQRLAGRTGLIRYVATNVGKGHADYFMSVVYALFAKDGFKSYYITTDDSEFKDGIHPMLRKFWESEILDGVSL